jgi:diguanylate cyclase (GGDEF)-like protein/PAS domain S-box-containing protein
MAMLQPFGPDELKRPESVRVLLLEDERTCAELVGENLRRIAGTPSQLDTVCTLAEALVRLHRGSFDLIIADINLPDSRGLETLGALARDTDRLIIVLTGDDDPSLQRGAMALGAYDFVHKRQLASGALERVVRLASMQANTFRSLRESEARFRKLTELSSDWYWEQDSEFRLTFMSKLVGGLRGIEPTAFLGRRRWDQPALNLTEADWARHRAQLERHEPFRDFEMQRLAGDGKTVWLSISGEPVFDHSGRFKGYRGVGRDITEHKGAEEELRRFRLAMDSSADMILLLDRATMKFIDVNNTTCRLLGYAREEILAIRPEELLPVSRVELETAYDRQIADPSLPAGLKSYYRCKDGSRLPFESKRQVLRSGDAWIIVIISRDIRERIASEQAVSESEARFRSLVELSSDFYWETDAEHRLTRTTHDQKYRPASQPVIGKMRWELSSIYPDEAGWAAHRAVLVARQPFHDFELGRIDPDGVKRYLSVSGEPVYGAHGEFVGYRGVGRDITERRREERLVALEHAVARALADADSVSAAIQPVIRAICESEGWPLGRYFIADDEAGLLRFGDAWGVADPAIEKFIAASRSRVYRRGQGLSGCVWQSGRPLWVSDTSHDPRATGLWQAAGGTEAAFVFPVIFEGKTIGVLSFSSGNVREPDERLLQTIHVIGSQIGQFLQRKQAESALSENAARFRQTFELAASGIAHVALDGRFMRVNRRLCEILGYSEEELVGRWVKDISHPEDRDVTDKQRARMRAGEVEAVRFEKRYLRKDGSVVWVNLTVALARNARGEPQHEISVLEDVTERKEREAALQRFRTALDSSADMVFLFRLRDGSLLDFNQSACNYLGYSREELLALRATDIRTDVTPETLRSEITELIEAPGRTNSVFTEYRRKDGSTFPVESRRNILDTPQGRVLVVNSSDLSERRSAEKRRAAQARYQKKIARLGQTALAKREAAELVEQAVQSVLEGLGGGAVAYLERGAGEREVVLRRAGGLAQPATEAGVADCPASSPLGRVLESSEPVVAKAPWTDGAPLPFEWARRYSSAAIVAVPGDRGARGALCALSEQPAAFGPEESRFLGAAASMVSAALHRLDSEARLAYLAQFDALTGLPNRALLSDRFSQTIVLARRRGVPLGVLFIDLDDFKLVNDTQGHAAGDDLLKETARRLQSVVRQGDTVARISGDEFAVVLGDLARPDDAALVAQKIIEQLAAPVALRGQEVFVTASIGIATFPADGDNAEALLGAADAAMYRAKQAGRNAFQFFTAEINQRTRARAQLGLELRRALERREFTLAYQPKIDLSSGKTCGAEALLRWAHPERGTVTPVEFIPVLEESGMIVAVGEWVLERACRDLKSWQLAGMPAIPVAVNLSARQFRQQDLEARIRAIVDAADVDPSLIELEITESQLMHDPEHATRVLRALGSAGLRIAIDDFGTGYSSLAYLTRFPLASLKIDRSFVAQVLNDQADATIVRTIIDMAHTLGFTVIAEGVESDPQAAFLRALGCEQAQGFLFARPMPAAEFTALISSLKAAASRGRRRASRRS